MKVSTKGRYGLRSLVYLAVHSSDGHVPLAAIAEGEGISFNYLEQVFAILRKAGIVKSIKGSQGGYVLPNDPSRIKVIDIIRVLEGDYNISEEKEDRNITQEALDNVLWSKINEAVNNIFKNTTLEDLVNEYKRLNNMSYDMYYI